MRVIFSVLFLLTHDLISGPGSSGGKALGYGLDGPVSFPGIRRTGDFSTLLLVLIGSGFQGLSPGVKAAECRTSLPTSF